MGKFLSYQPQNLWKNCVLQLLPLVGFNIVDMGLHSIWSGAAMSMYLNQIPIFTIMLIGQWSSNAFLRYIRKQVQEFSKGVSRAMITMDDFFTIPKICEEDPRILGHCLNLHGHKNFGHDAVSWDDAKVCSVSLIALWHSFTYHIFHLCGLHLRLLNCHVQDHVNEGFWVGMFLGSSFQSPSWSLCLFVYVVISFTNYSIHVNF